MPVFRLTACSDLAAGLWSCASCGHMLKVNTMRSSPVSSSSDWSNDVRLRCVKSVSPPFRRVVLNQTQKLY